MPEQNYISMNFQFDIKNNKFTCNSNELSSVLKDKLNFIYDYQPINFSQTIEQNKISNDSTNKITDMIYNINFRFPDGKGASVSLDVNCPIWKALKIFIHRNKNYNLLEKLSKNRLLFLFNATKIDVQKDKPIKQIFGNNTNSSVIVINDYNIIG